VAAGLVALFGVLPPLVFLVWAFLQNGLLGALL